MPKSSYIHIPFCRSKCNYCSFVSYENVDDSKIKEYVEVLLKEINYFYKKEPQHTVYLGGGTPSLLDVESVSKIVGSFETCENAEITLELNPETVDYDYLKKLYDIGVNRLSAGVQSFDDEILKKIGRIHNSKKAMSVFEIIRRAGFENYSCDFIYGLPSQSIKNFLESLKIAVELGVPHISLYGLKIEEGCKFYKTLPSDLPDDDMQADMYLAAIEFLEANGYKHYEISNFSKQGFESRHNLNYWNDKEYYGFGAAAHGYVGEVRYSNFCDLKKYKADFKNKEYSQTLTEEQKLEEKIFLGFRKGEGISAEDINKEFCIDFEKEYADVLSKYIQSGHLIRTKNGYRFSNEGFLLSNMILCEFMKNY